MGNVFGTVSTIIETALLPNPPEFNLPPMNENSGTAKAQKGQGAWLGGDMQGYDPKRFLHLVDTTNAHNESKLGVSGNIVVALLASLAPQPGRLSQLKKYS